MHMNEGMRRAKTAPGAGILLLAMVFLCAAGLSVMIGSGAEWRARADAAPGVALAIEDWDGDRSPDLATVQETPSMMRRPEYAIRVRFRQGADAAIGIEGPAGGVRLSPRDVNGDRVPDLVVTSVLGTGVVAVLLNDGHGHFSVAGPNEFPQLKKEREDALEGPATLAGTTPGLAPARSDTTVAFESGLKKLLAAGREPLAGQRPDFVEQEHQFLKSGRAPPKLIRHS